MAVKARASKLHFLVVLLVISSSCLRVQCIQEFVGACGLTIDLFLTQNVNSGILKMALPDSMLEYQDPNRERFCDILINFASGMNLMIELYFLDIMPKTGDLKTCTTGLKIFDQTRREYYGSTLCMEGWQWEERHREKQNEKLVVPNSPLTIRLVSSAPYRGEGFKLHFNQIRPNWPCVLREFRCQQIQYCVNDDLTCDGWDDCGDYSDERIDAGCDLLTASEICAIIIGIILIIGSVAGVFLFCIYYRRLSMTYGVRSGSKIPIINERVYNHEPTYIVGRGYSQESIPYSRSTAMKHDSDGDTIDKVDLERADRREMEPLTGTRMSNRPGDNMSERSYRSNPRRLVSQATTLGTEAAPPDPIKKSGQYSVGGRKGRAASQSSLNRSKSELANGKEDASDRNSLDDRVGSRENLSGRDRERSGRYRDRSHYSDSDDYSDDDPKRRSSRERDRRSGRYSDDDSDYDRYYRRRRRRSYDRYSDEDSDYEYERERRRRSRERYRREKYDSQDNSDVGGDGEKDKERPSKRRDSRERDRSRERYIRDRLDDEEDSDRGRGLDKEKEFYRKESRERNKGRYRDDDDDRPVRRRSGERRRGTSADRDRLSGDLSRDGNMRSRSRENVRSRDRGRQSPPLPAPPPYTEEDTKPSLSKQFTLEDKRYSQNLPPPPAEVLEMSNISFSDKRSKRAASTEDRHKEQQIQKPQPTKSKIKETQIERLQSAAPDERYREPKIPKPQTSEVSYRESHTSEVRYGEPQTTEVRYRESQTQKVSSLDAKHREPQKPPASSDVYKEKITTTVVHREKLRSSEVHKEKQIQKAPSEVKYREPYKLRTLEVDLKPSDEDSQKPVSKEVKDVDRRRNTDDRRERYSRARWTPKKKELDSPPPEYEDVAPTSIHVAASYREESV